MVLKTIKFPSAGFPSADLRVNADTQYEFACASCGAILAVPFGWILQTDNHLPTVTPEQIEQVGKHFQSAGGISGGHFELVHCISCDTAYVVQAQIHETSWDAYRVIISGVAEVVA